jgi:hypothetical protein
LLVPLLHAAETNLIRERARLRRRREPRTVFGSRSQSTYGRE